MTPTSVILWTGTTLFVATAVIAVLALIGRVTLGGGDGSRHHEYMKWLFGILIAEVVSASVVAFGVALRAEQRPLCLRPVPRSKL